ncbi:PREDICTED: luciferin 4-monooxygenase-like [Wasmannia auropunctata]|uniref:luciferin 4-monooxygenase-like n=1 Tax=Wasmannia auropunctata TaxID=64793 RepID=UPI0005EDCFA5|nr:PREDICTED: luciferin 4-monooxygenase-like [Wasmannia auropunctata]
MAIVSVVPGKTVTEQELISLVEKNMRNDCMLRGGVKFIDKIPHTNTGKIARKQLRDMFLH